MWSGNPRNSARSSDQGGSTYYSYAGFSYAPIRMRDVQTQVIRTPDWYAAWDSNPEPTD